jgi:ubiquinone/menaquinone biosynthesis C-methylase UbiE
MVVFRTMLLAWIYAHFVDPRLRDIRITTPDFAGMKAGDRVLDVCCGTGDQALYYARRGVESVGVDQDSSMIKMAGKNKKKWGLDNASFQVANAASLPFGDRSFNCISISLALHEKEESVRDAVISEMKRVVRSEGALVFIDFAVPLPRNIYGLGIRVVEFFAGWNHFKCSRDYIRRGGLNKLLKRHGLHEEKRHYLKYGTIAIIKTGNY